MLRTTANSTIGNRNSLEAALALWTPRNYHQSAANGNNSKAALDTKQQQQHQQQPQHPFVTPRFHQKRHFTVRGGGGKKVSTSDPGQTQQVDVLNKLPSIFNSSRATPNETNNTASHQDSHLQLPLLHGNKRERLQQQYNPHQVLLLQQHQPMPPTQEAQLIDAVEAAYEAVEERLRDLNNNNSGGNHANARNGKSRFRISVRDRPNLKQQQQQQQQQQQRQELEQELEPSPQQQEPRATIPIAYFSRNSGSWRSARVDDPDARSCDLRHPNQTVAYSRAIDYIQDNELMPTAKSRSIWRWIDELDESGARTFFVYDQTAKWFASEENGV